MKFAKELERELVPEWRVMYLDYKTGKKKIKAITRALKTASRTPGIAPRSQSARYPPTPSHTHSAGLGAFDYPDSSNRPAPSTEQQPLQTPGSRLSGPVGSYGSIVASPRQHIDSPDIRSLRLPEPAIDPNQHDSSTRELSSQRVTKPPPVASQQHPSSPLEPELTKSSTGRGTTATQPGTTAKVTRLPSGTSVASAANRTPQFIRRVFSYVEDPSSADPYREVEKRQNEFYAWLDDELKKIDQFYRKKEEEAQERYEALHQQLHAMSQSRQEEMKGVKAAVRGKTRDIIHRPKDVAAWNAAHLKETLKQKFSGQSLRFGKNSQSLARMETPGLRPRDREFMFDRREDLEYNDTPKKDPGYRTAKHQLKIAMQELLFARSIRNSIKRSTQKKPLEYMTERVNKSYFVRSGETADIMRKLEDWYGRYFEAGNTKIAATKLRSTTQKSGDYSPHTFRAGLFLMAGILFAIQALVYAARNSSQNDPTLHVNTSYLLQLYGGYFMISLHLFLFCLACMVWSHSRVNYRFIFEYNTRHTLEWRQLLEVSAFFMFLLGLFMWLNFSWVNEMYIYWPVVLIGLSVFIIYLPAPVLYHQSRSWWAATNWRLWFSGVYKTVEFRDFFLGDMYCSQTYAMGNIELFFCLYATYWDTPATCNSSHSRVMGVFTCLPSFWRACQCIRRYTNDKKHKKLSFPQDAFPHLFNLAKYVCGIAYYSTLSMWRINRSTRFQAPFLTFALLNSIYTSIWDVLMDWSLGDPYAKHVLLRDELAFRYVWIYYGAIVLDIVVRFNWIFYAIFSHDIQHSALLSFFVALSEVLRRGVWSILRVENEHCANVTKFHASREPKLPYKFEIPQRARESSRASDVQLQEQPAPTLIMPVIDVETGVGTPETSTIRPRIPPGTRSGSLRRFSFRAGTAHTQDFERRQLPTFLSEAANPHMGQDAGAEDSDDEDDYTETEGTGTPPLNEEDETRSSSGSERLPKEVDT
ncbi:hypothetical protein N7539_000442 [Penicillium diatomitis]|uniref:SPX domain-containing protein n=1 Tax=Penicillium diatomitis TaxID=2819901 RepID=A0A9X0C2C0_9EURO|nr:uncharacterized protein N7539_000442 [Penicillium diatomitis]KAJ5495326.1 hypothetical protein N7539_000442 [Penicillium diatomitis]